jgi:hypothetical protein
MRKFNDFIKKNPNSWFDLIVQTTTHELESSINGCFDLDGVRSGATDLILDCKTVDGVLTVHEGFILDNDGCKTDTGDIAGHASDLAVAMELIANGNRFYFL